MNNDNFICIFRWMHAELGLDEKQEKVYAYIYGITKDGESVCTSSHATISEMCNCSVSTVKRKINELEDGGFIKKKTESKNGMTYCKYWVCDVEKKRKEGRRKALMEEAKQEIKKRNEMKKKREENKKNK